MKKKLIPMISKLIFLFHKPLKSTRVVRLVPSTIDSNEQSNSLVLSYMKKQASQPAKKWKSYSHTSDALSLIYSGYETVFFVVYQRGPLLKL